MQNLNESQIIALGHGTGEQDLAHLINATSAKEARIRQLAISALVRRNIEQAYLPWKKLASDADWNVRRRVAELGIDFGEQAVAEVIELMNDEDSLVCEMACFAAGEIFENAGESKGSKDLDEVIAILISNSSHEDPLVRESAIASLGNIGDDRARETVIAACKDKAPIRRRAVVALSAFTGAEVEQALDVALEDVDWQVRQAAEDISGKKSSKE